MSSEDHSYDQTVDTSLTAFGLDAKDDAIHDRVTRELTPILQEHSALITQIAEALKTKDKEKLTAAADSLIAAFAQRGVAFQWDEERPRDNLASLDYQDDTWILKRHPVMFIKDSETVREYAHEFGAFLLITQHLQGKAPENLDNQKWRLTLGAREGKPDQFVFLSNIFDEVIKQLAKAE